MLATVTSCTIVGIDGHLVKVEVDVSNGLPSFDIVGLPDTAVRESKERVKAAIRNSGLQLPLTKVTVNLAPADIRKEGPLFDLPIAIAILGATHQINPVFFLDKVIVGELSLDGSVRSITGCLPIVMAAKEAGVSSIIIPKSNVAESCLVRDIHIYPVNHLIQIANHDRGQCQIEPLINQPLPPATSPEVDADFSDIKGQAHAKRALEIAAAGGHNVLMTGPPGSGKTLLARSIPSILPQMTLQESLDVAKIYSVKGLSSPQGAVIANRPFRAPHHSISAAGLIGGGRTPTPGEVSLSHNGVLFLDEMTEFSKGTLEQLRQPLEDGIVTIARVQATYNYPSRFMLVAAMNPCPCGYSGDHEKQCICTPNQVQRYMNKISGPLLDRIDIYIPVPRIPYDEIVDTTLEENSHDIQLRVEHARQIQWQRFDNSACTCNAGMPIRLIKEHALCTPPAESLIKQAFDVMKLSARGYTRILKVARTIADLDSSNHIESHHMAEAIQYRTLET